MDTRDAPRFLGSTVDLDFEIDFTEDIKELQEIDRTWSGVFVGPEPRGPSTGTLWMDSRAEPPVLFVYSGTSWIETKIGKV